VKYVIPEAIASFTIKNIIKLIFVYCQMGDCNVLQSSTAILF